jgi:hypothetical protein
VGDGSFTRLAPDADAVGRLAQKLVKAYPADHRVVLYAAATLPTLSPVMDEVALGSLSRGHVTQETTLYVPPLL